jgi:two-component system, cell cycle sensor histidine kinase and response regulator CckA
MSDVILVVDDDNLVCQLAGDILRRFNFTVLTARSGGEAIEIFRGHPEISAVLLDMIMPDMDGSRVFSALRAINSEVIVILSSGYTQDYHADELLAQGAAAFIQKPYRVTALVQVIQDVLATKNKTAFLERTP